MVIPIILVAFVLVNKKYNLKISVDDVRENIEYLASDSLQDRKSKETDDSFATEFIFKNFENAGQRISVDIIRDVKEMVLIIQL